jgi:Lysyl oxidase/WD40-like Beta Propeller Repeat
LIGGIVALVGAVAFTQSPGIAVSSPGFAPKRVYAYGFAPAWNATGKRLAFVLRGDVWAMDADGTHLAQLTHTDAAEEEPQWSPDGRSLVFEREGAIYTIAADGTGERRIVANGNDPAWSPDGTRIAFGRDGDLFSIRLESRTTRPLTQTLETEAQPAWSPDAKRVVYADETGIHLLDVQTDARSLVTDEPGDANPVFSPDGHRVAFERAGSIWIVAGNGTGERRIATGRDPSWQPVPRRPERLPDVVERPPTGLMVSSTSGRWLLGFTTAVDNVGDGPFVVVGRRPPGSNVMEAAQRVTIGAGRYRIYPKVGLLHYQSANNHHHWHFQPYERYELRSRDGTVLVRDRKQGFCLADHYGRAPGVPHGPPAFLGNCAWGDPLAVSLVEGTSVGYTDIYPAYFHGQSLDITGVPAGQYLIVNRVNPFLRFRELRYDNDAAALAIRLRWDDGAPRISVLRACRAIVCG